MGRTVRRDLALVTVVFALIAVWLLHRPAIWMHGEAREGLVVQDVVRNGDWVLPRRNGALPSKPPLYHWIAATVAHVAGLSDATLRTPSALAAWVMLVTTYLLGARIGGRAVAWLGIGALAGTWTFWTSAGEARTDMVFSACVTVALAGFLFWTLDGRPGARVVCYAAATLAVLAKGPAGAILPGIVIVGFAVATRRLDRLRALWSWPLVVGALVVAVGWYAAAYRAGGAEFLQTQLLKENVHRFVGRGEFGHARWRNPFRMELTLLLELLPWSLVVPWAILRRWRGAREDEAGVFLHAWWIGILVFFSLAAGKRGVYLLPLHPAIALLAARALAAVDGRVPAALRRLAPARPAVALVAGAILTFDVGLLATNQTLRELRARRRSLAPFTDRVATLVPAGEPLRAGPGVAVPDVYILGYRLARPLPRARVRCAEETGYWLVPARGAGRGGRVLAMSARKGEEQIALIACDGAPSRHARSADPPS